MGGPRYWEIDAIRGTAVVMMVVFHTVFLLSFLGVISLKMAHGPWRLLALATATLFIAVAGISIAVSSARAAQVLDRRGVAAKNLRRGAGIFLLGMGISLVTWLLLPGQFILFGVLHCIGISIALSPLFLPLGGKNLIPGALCILLSPVIQEIEGPLAFAWLGIHPVAFTSLDYVPLVPWFGVFLAGMGIGAVLYPGGLRSFPAGREERPALRPVTFLGRHSLFIYLAHVPVIALILVLLVPGLGARILSLLY